MDAVQFALLRLRRCDFSLAAVGIMGKWQAVEACDGFSVLCIPAEGDKPEKFLASLHSNNKHLPRPQLKLSLQAAREEGAKIVSMTNRAHTMASAKQQQLHRTPRYCAMPAPSFAGAPGTHPSAQHSGTPQHFSNQPCSFRQQHAMAAFQPPPPALPMSAAAAVPAVALPRAAAPAAPAFVAATHVPAPRPPAAMAPAAAAAPSAAAAQLSEATAALSGARTGPLTNSMLAVTSVFDDELNFKLRSGSCIQLGALLGSGGFASVYAGSVLCNSSSGPAAASGGFAQPITAAQVAVKVYKASKQGAEPALLQEYTNREYMALQLLRGCTHAVQLLAAGTIKVPAAEAGSWPAVAGSNACNSGSGEQLQCLVLELLDGCLADGVKTHGHCPEAYAKDLFRQVLQLLHIMHSGQLGYIIVHRDIKPANLLFGKNGRLVVGDFGACFIQQLPAAQAHQQPAAVSGMQTIVGTPFYLAPEFYSAATTRDSSGGSGVLDAAGSGFDTSVDVFAAGVTAIEVLTGKQLCQMAEVPMGAAAMQVREQKIRSFVDMEAPEDVVGVFVSGAAREFVGCCCGVGRQREAAAARGEAKRMTPAALLETAWMRG